MTSYFEASIGDEQQLRVALSKGGLTLELMKIIGNKGELGKIMVDALKAHLEAVARKAQTFEDEETDPSKLTYGYPDGWGLKLLGEQAAILAQRFPGLDVSRVEELAARYYIDDAVGDDATGDYRNAPKKGKRLVLPKGMDGLVVVPKPSAIARLAAARCTAQRVAIPDVPAENLALWELLGVMSTARSDFYDYTKRDVGPKRYKLTDKTKKVYAAFDDLPGDVMVLAVQTGFLHRGKSVRRARFVFGECEFGLCAFAVGCILLTHPERLTHVDHLWIDCAGSEFAPESGVDFSRFPFCYFYDGRLGFNWLRVSRYAPRYGSASGASSESSA